MVAADTRVDIAKESDSFILCDAFAQVPEDAECLNNSVPITM